MAKISKNRKIKPESLDVRIYGILLFIYNLLQRCLKEFRYITIYGCFSL